METLAKIPPTGNRRRTALHAPSSKACESLPEPIYPFHGSYIPLTACGRICMARKKINVSTVHAGQRLGIKEVDDGNLTRELHALRSGIFRR